ncbi:MAG TPA: hypothetical protein VL547_04470 [Dinghuibacter sp.]|uniref:hypothetical protein n=1 Tax=Dinghuibacter sp. TaxID=2024697 RepID=UPI002C36C7A7|nr:hypothetical protein [Dinghuibacter sp.]HTJ11249.1 hypothetical protein [Dinghuibacter sp.]
MKKISIAFYTGFICALLMISTGAHAQDDNVDAYFKNSGCALLAKIAHPSGTAEDLTYDVYSGYVLVDISYKGGTRTRLRVDRSGGGFSRVSVLYDNGFIAPFALVKLVADVALDQYQGSTSKNEIVRYLENSLDRELEDWNGSDWAALLVNLDYFSN